MRRAIDETDRRRQIQTEYNKEHNITPKGIQKLVKDILDSDLQHSPQQLKRQVKVAEEAAQYLALSPPQLAKKIKQLENRMFDHAKNLEFEEAAKVRDQINQLKQDVLIAGQTLTD